MHGGVPDLFTQLIYLFNNVSDDTKVVLDKQKGDLCILLM